MEIVKKTPGRKKQVWTQIAAKVDDGAMNLYECKGKPTKERGSIMRIRPMNLLGKTHRTFEVSVVFYLPDIDVYYCVMDKN